MREGGKKEGAGSTSSLCKHSRGILRLYKPCLCARLAVACLDRLSGFWVAWRSPASQLDWLPATMHEGRTRVYKIRVVILGHGARSERVLPSKGMVTAFIL